MPKMKNVVMLLGAGASTYCDIPTGVTLVNKIIKDVKSSKIFFDDLKRNYKSNKIEPDFEDYLVFLDLMEQDQISVLLSYLNETQAKDSSGLPKIGKLSKDLRKDLIKGLRAICLNFDEQKAEKQYKHLFELNNKINFQIFTTNYDPVLETVLDNMRIDYSTNFKEVKDGKKLRFIWDSTCESLSSSKFQIAKLHGSIYWYKDKITDEIEEIFLSTNSSTKRNPVSHIMITPTVFKDIYQPPYYSLYNHFQETLKKSSLLIVVGHSLRDEWLYGAIVEHLDKERSVVYVGRKRQNDVSERIKVLMENEGFIYFPLSSEKFFPFLGELISSSRFEDKEIINSLTKSAKNANNMLEKKVTGRLTVPTKKFSPGEKVHAKVEFGGTLIKGYYRLSICDLEGEILETKDVMRDNSGIGTLSGYSKKRRRNISIKIPDIDLTSNTEIVFHLEIIDQPSTEVESETIVLEKEIHRRIK